LKAILETLHDLLWIILLGVSLVYSALVRVVISLRKNKKLSIPVISVGNIHLGGTGKTPLVIKLAQHFSQYNPAVASRGYKGQVTHSGALCDLSVENGPKVYGDEPWLIALKSGCEVFVGKNRFKTLSRFQVERDHSLVILDDGFQHTHLKRTVDLVLIPGECDPSTSACIPLGALREPLSALKRASAVLLTFGELEDRNLESWKNLIQQIAPNLPLFVAQRKAIRIVGKTEDSKNEPLSKWGAFCGIARPSRFFSDLKKWGKIYEEIIFPDHHNYTKSDVLRILKAGQGNGISGWITTEKDYIKVAPLFKTLSGSDSSLCYAALEYDYPAEFFYFIERKLSTG